MMTTKELLLSIKPEWLAKILNGEITVLVRKQFPKDYVGWVNLYCTKGVSRLYRLPTEDDKEWYTSIPFGWVVDKKHPNTFNGKVVARFWCDKVDTIVRSWNGWVVENQDTAYTNKVGKNSGLDCQDLDDYLKGKDGKAIHITKLEIFDRPKELNEFCTICWGDKYIQVHPLTQASPNYMFVYERRTNKYEY